MKRYLGLGLVTLGLVAGGVLAFVYTRPAPPAPETPDGPPWFADVTEERGIHFLNHLHQYTNDDRIPVVGERVRELLTK